MTTAEWKSVNEQFATLLHKKDRSELEELRYKYLDKIITYVSLIHQAKEMGNRNPQGNFLIQNAKARMEEAERKLREFIGSQKVSD